MAKSFLGALKKIIFSILGSLIVDFVNHTHTHTHTYIYMLHLCVNLMAESERTLCVLFCYSLRSPLGVGLLGVGWDVCVLLCG